MSDADEPNYTFFGDALSPLDEEDVAKKKPIHIEDQVATDKQGRRRFHGAFTGGFSAGFYNSVGSLEGWKPSTFQSSRAEKADKRRQLPEDFMDDEDQEVFGIAPKVLRAKGEYTETRTRATFSNDEVGPIPEALGTLGELLKPVRDSVGTRLLKRMGWKQGQGVGPRVSSKEKKQQRKEQALRKTYGCDMGPLSGPAMSTMSTSEKQDSDSSESEQEDETNEDVTFAPEDLPAFLVQPKTNTHGMGYTGLDRRPVLSAQTSGHINLFEIPEPINSKRGAKRGKLGIRGQAFGVGAFEAEDEDIYGADDMSRYDFSLESAGERKKKRWEERQEEKKKKKDGGADCLEGFCKATLPMSTVQYFPSPTLPKDFIPKHVVKKSRFDAATVAESGEHRKQGLGRHDLTAEQRSVLIGDAPKRGEKRHRDAEIDIVDLTEAEPAQKISRFSDKPPEIVTLDEEISVVPTEFKANQFNPFTHDPDKLLRYQKYLTLIKEGRKESLQGIQPSSMTEWERNRERNEFEQAARLYQPLSGPISDRFVSSATLLGHDEKPHSDALPVEASVSAAKLKMYGKLTRTREAWQPCSLLCKRFNVPEPNSGVPMTASRKRPTFSVFDFLAAAPRNVVQTVESSSMKLAEQAAVLEKNEPQASTSSQPVAESQTETQATDNDIQDLPTDAADKIDLYKAIFLSSSEGEEEDEPPPSAPTTAKVTTPVKKPESPPKPRNTSPPRGVFANIYQVVAPPPGGSFTPQTPPGSPPSVEPKTPPGLPPDIYGPSLPTTKPSPVVTATPYIVPLPLHFPSSGQWVEKTKKKESKKKKKDKDKKRSHGKHKKHKSKSKKRKKEPKSKHKKKSKNVSSSSSTSSTSE